MFDQACATLQRENEKEPKIKDKENRDVTEVISKFSLSALPSNKLSSPE